MVCVRYIICSAGRSFVLAETRNSTDFLWSKIITSKIWTVINIGSKTQCDPFNYIKSHCAVQFNYIVIWQRIDINCFSRWEVDHWHRSALEGGTWCFGSRSTWVDRSSRGWRWGRGGSSWAEPSWQPSSSWWPGMRSGQSLWCHHHHHGHGH